jgi:hypothetical protein
MPGFLAGLALGRSSRTVVGAFTNVTRGVDVGALATEVLESVLPELVGEAPGSAAPIACVPQPCPASWTAVLGRWWCEAEETVFTWQDGALRAHLSDRPNDASTVFTREDDDLYRATAGRLKGERLSIIREPDGRVPRLEWATYPYTRSPR